MDLINRLIDNACGSQYQRHHVARPGSSSSVNVRFTDPDDPDNSKNIVQIQTSDYEYEQMQKKRQEEFSFGSQFAVSIFAIIFCGVLFGIVAMILSVRANRAALYYNKLEKARRLGFASYVVSIIGIILGTATIAGLIMWQGYLGNADVLNDKCWSSYEVYMC